MRRLLFGGLNPSKAGWPGTDLTVTKLCGFTARITGLTDPVIVTGGAEFSPCGKYRYRLWRVLAERIDVERATPPPCVRFDVVNLSALISTDPEGLDGAGDAFGPDCMRHINEALLDAEMVIAAWGSLAQRPAWIRYQGETVLRAFSRSHDVRCLGKTADGSPRHPSRIAYSTPLELFRERRTT